MGIENFMERVCVQTAVYWAAPVADGYGGLTHNDPIEISCRWQENTEVISMLGGGRKGEELISNAQVFVTQDLVEEGYLFLGDLDDLADLSSSADDDPEGIDGAYKIIKFEKTPAVRGTDQFLRKAYL